MIYLATLRVLPLLAAVVHAYDHLIDVGIGPDGKPALRFNPQTVAAYPGDRLKFRFNPKNHSVTQSTFPSPCSRLDDGLDSGFMPVQPGSSSFPNFTVVVNDTKPLWFYCKQPGPPNHCYSGMVFAANPPSKGNTFDLFQMAAIASGNASTTASPGSGYTMTPSPVIETVTRTVTLSQSTYTTTYASSQGAPANPTPDAQPAVHTIVVGGSAGLRYSPNNVTAKVGDILKFEFHSKNHTATQSSFNSPCHALEGGFDSGFQPVDLNATYFPTYNVTINDTSPVWVYCRQADHCLKGMVFGANAPTSGPKTIDAFTKLAMYSNFTGVAAPAGV